MPRGEEYTMYSRLYGLRINPFPSQGSFPVDTKDEPIYAKCYIMDEESKRKIRIFLDRLIKGSSIPVLFVIADYGYGKTHFLKYLYYKISEQTNKVFPIYIKNIDEPKALDLYKAVIDGIYRTFGRDVIMKIAARSSKLSERERYVLRSLIPDLVEILPKISKGNNTAIRWLFAENLSSDEINNLKVIHLISEKNAVNAIQAIVKLIYFTLKRKIVLLIDELEETIASRERGEIRR
ncbi:MAG: P-loop NTPase fold protein, partial [Candidatus Njordarchaeota archaeon]